MVFMTLRTVAFIVVQDRGGAEVPMDHLVKKIKKINMGKLKRNIYNPIVLCS